MRVLQSVTDTPTAVAKMGENIAGIDPYLITRNLYHFGAAGDGVTDDTAAIELAVAEIQRSASNKYPPEVPTTAQGGVLRIPAGRYLISRPIKLVGNTTVIGSGMGSTVIENTTTDQDTFSIDTTVAGTGHQIVIRDLTIIGSQSATAGRAINADDGQNGQLNIDISNVRVFGHHTGIRLRNAVHSRVTNVWCVKTVSHGFVVDGSANAIVFTDTEADHCGGNGYDIGPCVACAFVAAYADYAGGHGMLFRATAADTYSQALSLSAIGIEYATGDGIRIELGKHVTINGAIVVGCTGHGVHLSGTQGVGLNHVHAETVTPTNNALRIVTDSTYGTVPYGVLSVGCHWYSAGTSINDTSKLAVCATTASDSWAFPSGISAASMALPNAGSIAWASESGSIGMRANGTAISFAGGAIYPSSYQLFTGATSGVTVSSTGIIPQNATTDLGSSDYPFQDIRSSRAIYAYNANVSNALYMGTAPVVWGSGGNTIALKPDASYIVRANAGARYPAGWQWDVTSGSWAIGATGTLSPGSDNTQDIGSAGVRVKKIWGVDFSGNAATASDADTLDGSHASAFAAASHTHSYESALGNPSTDGSVLASTAAGVRSWAEVSSTATASTIAKRNADKDIEVWSVKGTGGDMYLKVDDTTYGVHIKAGTSYPHYFYGNGNAVHQGTVQASSGYKSSDGTAGVTADVVVRKGDDSGSMTLHFKNGLYVGSD